MNILFAGVMVFVGIGAGLVVAGMVVAKERAMDEIEKERLREEIRYEQKLTNNRNGKVMELNQRNIVLESQLRDVSNRAAYFEKLAKSLQQQSSQKQSVGVASEDKELIAKALKKAMFASHPDRNNGTDDGSFQKFNELYKRYK